jgi:hypothetical protein
MSDAEIKYTVIGMLTASNEAAAGGEMHPGLVAAVAAVAGIEAEGSIPEPPLVDGMTREEIRAVLGEAVRDAVREVGSHYRRVLLYMVSVYLELAAEAHEAGVDVRGLLQQRAVGDDHPLPS